ncbi:MAG TPA: MBL fold metallo-hydrolase [Bryobacteraceae bacterium]|nr:MBL fold metallo-hydrolase [Bryobacteraceae bacterium]
MKLTFWGAAQTVTGSMHQVTVGGRHYLLDCGTYQGRRREARERNLHLPFAASRIEAVLLSHAHIDHSGNLPTLTKNGFQGPIWSTPATCDLCEPMLLDSAFLQEKDAVFLNKRAGRRKLLLGPEHSTDQIEPLYTTEDVERMLPLFKRAQIRTPYEVGPGLSYESFDAGHMLGSTSMLLDARENGSRVRLAFSGDVGRVNLPIIPDPEPCPEADYLILESTYGGRLHQPLERAAGKLGDVIRRTAARGGKIIVPAFAVGRTQQLVLMLHQLTNAGRIPAIPIFVDSPLAAKTTAVFRKHAEAWDAETNALAGNGNDPFGFRRLRFTDDVNESKALNQLRGPFLVISSSGMCEAGRILHHLRNNIEDPRNTILITGYQAENTLGRKIVDKQPEVPIFGEPHRLRAEVVKLNELSGHADQRELVAWIRPVARRLKAVFLVHGEPAQQTPLAEAIRQEFGITVHIPARGNSFDLT